jgi:hypothetical protein
MTAEDLALHFDWAIFALNGCFPKATPGTPLLQDWNRCAVFHSQIVVLLEIYKRFSNSLRPPILLCEIVRRCAWYLVERGNFKDAKCIVSLACEILETGAANNNHPGYYPRYMCRLTADLYSTFGSIDYEQNAPLYGRQWFEKADAHRMRLLENETAEAWDIEMMAIVDGNIALTYLAENIPGPSIASYNLLLETFHDKNARSIWASNLSIAYRIRGETTESLLWCKKSFDWTIEAYGEESLSMAM